MFMVLIFFFQAEDGIRDHCVTEFRRVLFRSQGVGQALFIDLDRSRLRPVGRGGLRFCTGSRQGALSFLLIFYAQARLAVNGTWPTMRRKHEKFGDRKSTCLNSSHTVISYAVF